MFNRILKKEKPVKSTEKKQLDSEENERVQKSRRGWVVNSVKHYRGPRNEIHEEPLLRWLGSHVSP